MTNEQAINLLKNLCKSAVMRDGDIVALKMAIKALEQEPSDVSDTNVGKIDAVNRQAAIEKIHWLGIDKDTAIMCDLAIRALPPVTPKQRTGHWIESRCDMWVCSNCGHTHTDLSGEKDGMNFCPNCGAKMENENMKTEATQDAGQYADAPTIMPGA